MQSGVLQRLAQHHAIESPAAKRWLPVWLWPNVLSLDAPLIAVLWQGFLAQHYDLPLRVPGRIVLGPPLPSTSSAPRISAAPPPPPGPDSARHGFCRRNRSLATGALPSLASRAAFVPVFWFFPALVLYGLAIGRALV